MLEVVAPTFPAATARDSIPPPPEFTVRSMRGTDSPYETEHRITITLNDPPVANWYRVAIYGRVEMGSGNDAWTSVFFSSGEPYLQASPATVGSIDVEVIPEGYTEAYFDDTSFNGSTLELVLNAHAQHAVAQLYVVFSSLSEAYFHYHRTLALQRRNEGDPLSDPIPIQDNVIGGFGIFAGYSDSVKMIPTN